MELPLPTGIDLTLSFTKTEQIAGRAKRPTFGEGGRYAGRARMVHRVSKRYGGVLAARRPRATRERPTVPPRPKSLWGSFQTARFFEFFTGGMWMASIHLQAGTNGVSP
jgi:hypothetical protein